MSFPTSLPEPAAPYTTKEGWSEQLAWHMRTRTTPRLSPNYEYLPQSEKTEIDEFRQDHHNSFGPIVTIGFEELIEDLCRLANTNRKKYSGARPGAVIDGLANHGKTTSLVYFGFEYEQRLRAKHGNAMTTKYGDEWHPVVYVTLNAQASVKSLNWSLLEFYAGMASDRRSSDSMPSPKTPTYRLTNQVVRHAQKCATTLILVDDIHYLNLRHEGAREVTNHLKQLANLTSATFVFAGVGLSETQLLKEGKDDDKVRFGQMHRRFTRYPFEAFATDTAQQARLWMRLVKAFEDEIVLLNGHKGMCTSISKYLHYRTKGVVGALSNLLRQGANLAIDNGTERITKKLLDEIRIDVYSESDLLFTQ